MRICICEKEKDDNFFFFFPWFMLQATSKIRVDPDICRRTMQNIKSKMLTEDAFDEVQNKVIPCLTVFEYTAGRIFKCYDVPKAST